MIPNPSPPTLYQGSGKTECARRLAKTTQSPFVRTEATRFTEVGIVGTTVEDMIKELVEVADPAPNPNPTLT